MHELRQPSWFSFQQFETGYSLTIDTSLGSMMRLTPATICFTRAGESDPIRSRRSDLSTVTIWEMLTTLSLFRLASPFFRRTLPGTDARFRFEVSAQSTTVLILLWLYTLFWM